jgi:hypothetical protein
MMGIWPSFALHPTRPRFSTSEGVEKLPNASRSTSMSGASACMPSSTATPGADPTARGSSPARARGAELTEAEVRDLTRSVVAAEGRGSTPFGSYLFSTNEPAADLARYVERSVLAEAFACPAAMARAAYDHYEPASLFICVLDHRRFLPFGAIRVVVPSPAGFKSLDEIDHHWHQHPTDVLARTPVTIDLAHTWDIATMMVCPGYRTGTVSQALHQALGTASTHAGITGYITILDLAVLRLLQFQLRRVFVHYHGVAARFYEGSPSLPVWADLLSYWERLRATHSVLYETIFEGCNLEAAVSTPDWDDALRGAGVGVHHVGDTISERRRSPLLTGGVGT